MTICHAFIQARMSSTRFPGKVLETIGGVSAIEYMVARVRRARLVDGIVVVTSTDASDDPLVAQLARAGIAAFRGELHDVLRRFAAAAVAHPADEYVRLTGDCPLIDPALVDAVIAARRAAGTPYACNTDPPSFPDGLDCETFTRDALLRADREATEGPHREHVTMWMRTDEAGLTRTNVSAPFDASHLRLTVDYPDDLEAVRRVVALIGPEHPFDFYDILRVIAGHPEISALNPHLRNESLSALPQVASPTGAKP